MASELTPKQRLFVEEFLIDLNATQAAVRAGYSEKTARAIGSENLAKPDIQEAIEQAMRERSGRTLVDADYVISTFKEIVERCLQKSPVMVRRGQILVQKVDDEGNHVWEFDASGANTALTALGKHLKLFTERTEVEHKGEVQVQVSVVDLEDRVKQLKGDSK